MKKLPVSFEGIVEKGRGEGGKNLVPTINLNVNPELDFGVYLCRVRTGEDFYFGLMNFGPRPTFALKNPVVEIFLLNFWENLYGQNVAVTVYNRIREIRKFKTPALLKAQIERDILTARKLIKKFHD